MKKIKEISQQEKLTLSVLPSNACQKIINKMAEGNIIMKTFTGYTWAVRAGLNSR